VLKNVGTKVQNISAIHLRINLIGLDLEIVSPRNWLRLVSDRGRFGKSKLNMLSREKRNLPLTRDFIFVDRFRSLSRLLDSRAILILTYSVERAGRRAGGNATTTFRPSSLFYSTRPAPGLLLSCRASCSVRFLPPRSCRKPSPVSASLTALQRRPPPYVLNPLRSPPRRRRCRQGNHRFWFCKAIRLEVTDLM
jgi:hypothetical protein